MSCRTLSPGWGRSGRQPPSSLASLASMSRRSKPYENALCFDLATTICFRLIPAGAGGYMAELGLVEAIEQVREELRQAMLVGAGADVQFPVGQVTLEFQVGLKKTGEGSG